LLTHICSFRKQPPSPAVKSRQTKTTSLTCSATPNAQTAGIEETAVAVAEDVEEAFVEIVEATVVIEVVGEVETLTVDHRAATRDHRRRK
jgi:hypothetical protein